ncbi:hypothetical protein LTR66_012794 [Elasticomyces elasticus]|nr:hypothetical protein LTR66_012794 [Elasticomyces elasticus]KAK5009000.1 hypothetical protein LTR28_003221 [Elasticomyces elasticus]
MNLTTPSFRAPSASALCTLRRITQSQLIRAPTSLAFSTSSPAYARNKNAPKKDQRIVLIRYFLQHPLTPRPLRFSRNRYLRHWTIHRAWQLFQAAQRRTRELELERQYNSMHDACEALRLIDGNGLTAEEGGGVTIAKTANGEEGLSRKDAGKDIGRLFRIAMEKKGIWDGVPIEYARIQTEGPSREGWNHAWTR